MNGLDKISRGTWLIERRYTRDAKIPLVAGDYEFDHGWRCVPLPPALDEGWEIFDESKDYKTGWLRVRFVGGVAT